MKNNNNILYFAYAVNCGEYWKMYKQNLNKAQSKQLMIE